MNWETDIDALLDTQVRNHIKNARDRWLEALLACPRVDPDRHPGDDLPVIDCLCDSCELWRRENRLCNNYRRVRGLPVARSDGPRWETPRHAEGGSDERTGL